MFTWGAGSYGAGGVNDTTTRSSPIQVPGTWTHVYQGVEGNLSNFFAKDSGTLWSAGYNSTGVLGLNDRIRRSSPTQIPGTTWSSAAGLANRVLALKTDGTLWSWGNNIGGGLGLNQGTPDNIKYSSPVQVGSDTTWVQPYVARYGSFGIKEV